jgi:acetyl esterase/lipase
MKRVLPIVALLFAGLAIPAEEPKQLTGVAYGKHPRQVLDFYPARSDKPTPVVFYIHGGGWQGGDKKTDPQPFLDKGISVVAINYRYVKNGVEQKVVPPVKAPLEDAARALQFVRSKAKEWNLDKKRIGATGGSAGACSSLWLAFHDDLARPDSPDPIARESTRLYCAAVIGAQTTLDPKPLREWIPNYKYGSHAFNLADFQALYDAREKILPWIKEYSPMEHVTKDDPPIYLFYNKYSTPPVVGTAQENATHSAVMGIKLEEKLKAAGVEVILVHQDRPNTEYPTAMSFLIDRLRK